MRGLTVLLAALASFLPATSPQDPAAPKNDSTLGDRLKTRSERLAASGRGSAPEEAVLASLAWLARHQDPDGGWRVTGFKERCAKDACVSEGSADYDTGVTALAVLAFLGAGYTPAVKDDLDDPSDPKKKWKPGETVRKGLERLRVRQGKDGAVGPRGTKFMYGHAIATLALAEAAAMTGAAVDKDAAKKAVAFLLDARNPTGAWRYSHRPGDNDTSVTGWCAAALDAATQAGLWTPEKPVREAVIGWMDDVTAPPGARAGYNGPNTGKVFVPSKNENYTHHETMTAISILARKVLGPPDDAGGKIDEGVKMLVRDLPENKMEQIDSYYWFWASVAVFRIDGPAGATWQRWVGASDKAIVPSQVLKGCSHGSWDSTVDRWGFEGGKVGVTALNALTLLTPAR